MSRNFEFAVPPHGGQRAGRYTSAASVQIGAPVVVSGAESDGRLPVVLQTSATTPPKPGKGGILVYEELFTDATGDSPSDVIKCPAASPVQVVSGQDVKVRLRNTDAVLMVAGVGATPTLSVGDYLAPQTSASDVNGYWVGVGTTATNAWLVVTSINNTTGEVEARLNF